MTAVMAPPKEFLDVARILEQDTKELLRTGEQCTLLLPSTLADARRVMSRASDEEKAARLPTFFQPNVALRRSLGQGQHDRGEAVLFAGGEECLDDALGLGRHLPIHVKALSVVDKRVSAGETWDLSVHADFWGLPEREELYVAVNVGTLVLEPGARVIVRGNVFSLLCQRMVCSPPEGGEHPLHVGILPTPFSVDQRFGPHDGDPGSAGKDGVAGADAEPFALSASVLGPVLTQARHPDCGRDGARGGNGRAGRDGGPGRNGGPCKLAEITVREIAGGPLALFVQAGRGGDGGAGGAGGAGGDGGRGSAAVRALTGLVPAGDGGDGGDGGAGGHGGNGGNGGISSNVYVTVAPAQQHLVRCTSLPSAPGRGGGGAPGGHGGRAASGGRDGPAGLAGRDGRRGRSRGAATVFINSTPTPSVQEVMQ